MEKYQEQFKSKVNEITTWIWKHKSQYQLDRIQNIKNFYNSRENRLPTALAQVKTGNKFSKSNYTIPIVYSSHQSKQITKIQ